MTKSIWSKYFNTFCNVFLKILSKTHRHIFCSYDLVLDPVMRLQLKDGIVFITIFGFLFIIIFQFEPLCVVSYLSQCWQRWLCCVTLLDRDRRR